MLHIVGGQLTQPPAADSCQDRRQDVLVLLDRLGGAAGQPVPQPVLDGAPDGVVRGLYGECKECKECKK